MKAIEKAEQAVSAISNRGHEWSGDIADIAITAFLDGILADPEAFHRIMDAVIKNQFRSDVQVADVVIEALKQEVING